MNQYHKIQTVWNRNPDDNHRTLIEGEYSRPEFEYLAGNPWAWTEKVDGTNIRVMVYPSHDTEANPAQREITFGGKTDNANIPAKLFESLCHTFLTQTETIQAKFPDGACLYGEGFGASIQKGGGNYRPDQGFVLFDVGIGDWWLQRSGVEDVAKTLDIPVVPIVGEGTLPEMIEFVRAGFNSSWGNFQAEGVVARPCTELRDRAGRRIITKLKLKDFG